MLVYKYLPPERIDVLRVGRIRFTPPSALNDPFECAPTFDTSSTIEDLRKTLLDKSRGMLSEFLAQPGLSEEDKQSAREVVDQQAQAIEKLTDPVEMGAKIIESLRDLVSHNVGVLSLSKTADNPVM